MPYTESDFNRATLASTCAALSKIQESCTDLLNYVDMTDSVTWRQEGGAGPSVYGKFDYGTAFGMALEKPSATACAYINEGTYKMLRARSRAFVIDNPPWKAVNRNLIAYAVGTGHTLNVVPRRKDRELKDSLKWDILEELELFRKLNKYRRRQGEKLTRLERDGEFILRYFEDREDGVLRVRFVEPMLILDPPGMGPADDVWFGIQFNNRDYEEPIRYFIKPVAYDGRLSDEMQAAWSAGVPADEIQHRTANVDLSSPRGLPGTYDLQDPCEQAVSTRRSLGKMVDIRARIALIVKQTNATLGAIQPLLQANRIGTIDSSGRTLNAFRYPYGTILNTNDQRSYEMPAPHLEADKIVAAMKADLQAVAASVGLADFCISGDASAAFANALVKEGPMDRCIGVIQQDLIDDDIEVYERALKVAIKHGRLPEDALKIAKIEILPPQVIARERLVNTQADQIMVQCGAMSTDTMAMRNNLDPEDERQKMKKNPSPMVLASIAKTQQQPGQPSMSGGTGARGVPSGSEPGPGVNPRRAEESLQEALKPPTTEDFAMLELVAGEVWRQQAKAEILGLMHTERPPKDLGIATDYQPGVRGTYLGTVREIAIWAIDGAALAVKHQIDEFVTGGNCVYWPFLNERTVIVDWSRSGAELKTIVFHEVLEARLMEVGKWAYARAHRMSATLEQAWLQELRPELAGLQPQV